MQHSLHLPLGNTQHVSRRPLRRSERHPQQPCSLAQLQRVEPDIWPTPRRSVCSRRRRPICRASGEVPPNRSSASARTSPDSLQQEPANISDSNTWTTAGTPLRAQPQQRPAPRYAAPAAAPPPRAGMPPPSSDQFAAFRAFQQLAALRSGSNAQRVPVSGSSWSSQRPGSSSGWPASPNRGSWDEGGGGGGGGNWQPGTPMPPAAATEQQPPPGARLNNFRRLAMTKLTRGWYAAPNMTAMEVHDEIMRRAAKQRPAVGALFMLCRLAATPEDLRAGLSACVAVRGALAAAGQQRRPLGGPRLAHAFVKACIRCDAPDVLASALLRANEAGLLLSYHGVHEALKHWAALQELHKVDQVLAAMPAGGLPFTTQTAYIAIRGAVNGGRQEVAENYAVSFQEAGVRLHPTTLKLLELGRERAQARQQALAEVTGAARGGAGGRTGSAARQPPEP